MTASANKSVAKSKAPRALAAASGVSVASGGDSSSTLALLQASVPFGPNSDARQLLASGAVAAPKRPGATFLTEPDSPFADGYSIRLEAAALAALSDGDDLDEAHPEYERWLELDERKLLFKKMQQDWTSSMGKGPGVTPAEAEGMRRLGALVDEESDQMEIHTKEGYRLFMGRSKDPEGKFAAIVGGKRIASALKRMWTMTSLNNPYADWALVRHDQNLVLMEQRLKQETQAGVQLLEQAKKRGLMYGVVRSAEPKLLTLGFKSPYGYTMAELVVSYDYYVRVMKSLARRNLMSDEQVRSAIREMTRFIRARLNETARFERWLLREEFMGLARVDFTEVATAEGKKRAEAAGAIFGLVPSEVFSGKVAPRHSRLRVAMTPADRRLLQEASAAIAASETAGEAGSVGGAAAADELVAGEQGLV